MPARSSATAVQPAHDIRSRRTKRHQSAKSRMHVPIATGITREVIRNGCAAVVAAKKQTCPSATTAAQAMEIAAFLLLKIAMGRGSQGIAWCFSQSAMVISFVCSVAFLGNPSTALQWAGLVLTLVALVLFAKDKPSSGADSNDAFYWRLVFGAFALIGAGQFLRLIPEYAGFQESTLTWRLPLMSPIGAVFWLSACAVKRIWKPGLVWNRRCRKQTP